MPTRSIRRFAAGRGARVAGLCALLAMGTSIPSASSAAPRAAKRVQSKSGSSLPNVTFAGFRLLEDGRAVVYVELTSKVPVNVQKQGTVITYELEGAQVLVKNNRNPLLTSQFATVLESARLVVVPSARKKGKRSRAETEPPRVQLVLRLREDVTPSHTFAERASGSVLEITLPAAGTQGVSGRKG